MKKIIALSLIIFSSIFCFTGCQSENQSVGYYSNTERFDRNKYRDFNKEVYVWEEFNFTTNKVER